MAKDKQEAQLMLRNLRDRDIIRRKESIGGIINKRKWWSWWWW